MMGILFRLRRSLLKYSRGYCHVVTEELQRKVNFRLKHDVSARRCVLGGSYGAWLAQPICFYKQGARTEHVWIIIFATFNSCCLPSR